MAGIHITDIEAAINWWRERSPSPDNISACAEVRALAEVYALMVYHHEAECDERSMPAKAHDAWLGWYDTTPDAPCIAICSTSQGDDWCKGCGRSFDEVQHWPVMSPGEKRATWRRITLDGTAWRFNRYAERAREGVAATATTAPTSVAPPAEAVVAAALARPPEIQNVVEAVAAIVTPVAPVAESPAQNVTSEVLPSDPAALVAEPVITAEAPALDTAAMQAVPPAAEMAEMAEAEHTAAEPATPARDTTQDTPVIVADELVDAVAAPSAAEAATALVVVAPASRPRKGLRAWWSRWVMRRRAG